MRGRQAMGGVEGGEGEVRTGATHLQRCVAPVRETERLFRDDRQEKGSSNSLFPDSDPQHVGACASIIVGDGEGEGEGCGPSVAAAAVKSWD